MAREKNPVSLMNSVNALDIMEYCYSRMKYIIKESPKRLAEIKEQIRRHRWELRKHIDGSFERTDQPEPKKKLTKT
jgi:hypothetical protein